MNNLTFFAFLFEVRSVVKPPGITQPWAGNNASVMTT